MLITSLFFRSMSCTLDGADAFTTLRQYLGTEEYLKIEASESGIQFDSGNYVRLSNEGCKEDAVSPSSTNWILIVSIIVVVVLVVIILVVCVVKKRSKKLHKTTPFPFC